MRLLRRAMWATIFAVSLAATLAWADDDPPGRVARLQYVAGSVSVQPQGTEEWVAGTLNRPLTIADNIWTDKESRAELSLGTAYLRMNGETSLTFTNLSDNTVHVQLHQGTLNLRIRKLYKGEIYEVDTPNLAFTVQKSGEYRFDVTPEGDATWVIVRKGEGDATGDGPAVRVRAGQRVQFTNGTSLEHDIYQASSTDGFDDWCRVRDRRLDGSYSARYVSPSVVGYEDLDDYGTWRVVPTYGRVWVPSYVGAGWAPYRYGHWVWISPWGWTWVDDAPWGFAPFHYGRWVYYGGYWGWAPGPYYARPVYAPALVAWFGGPRWGVSLAFGGGYGWCPLGYGDPFIPWYRGSRNYFRNVNITNTRITNITYITNNYYNWGRKPRTTVRAWNYANVRHPGGVTAVPQRTLVGSLPVSRNMLPVSAKDTTRLTSNPLEGKMTLQPTRESRLGANTGRPAMAPPQRSLARPVVSKLTPRAAVQARMPRTEIAQLDKANRPLEGRMTNRQPTGPLAGRAVPRPGLAVDKPTVTARGVPRPPLSGRAEVRATQPVTRPPAAGRPTAERAIKRATPGSARGDAPGANAKYSASPALRPVPRPSPGNVARRPDVEPRMSPRPEAGPTRGRAPETDVSRPTGTVAPPSRRPEPGVYRPHSTPPSAAPQYRAPDQAGPRSYGETPRQSVPDSPRMSGPAPGRGMPQGNSAPSRGHAGGSSRVQAPQSRRGQ